MEDPRTVFTTIKASSIQREMRSEIDAFNKRNIHLCMHEQLKLFEIVKLLCVIFNKVIFKWA